MRSLVTDATPYKQGLRESLDFGSFLSARAVSTHVESIGDSQGTRFLIHTDHR